MKTTHTQHPHLSWLCILGLYISFLLPTFASATPNWGIEVEGGWVWPGRIDVRIPGDAGTRFSFRNDLDVDNSAYARGRLFWKPADRHTVIATVVPLEISARGEFAHDTRFADSVFAAGTPVRASYRFNNYRLTYRYHLIQSERGDLEVGATAFIRDARVKVSSADQTDSDDDLGFVPLLHIRAAASITPSWRGVIEGDALAAPQGRAVDLFIGTELHCGNSLVAGFGYRVLEGGADNDTVYTFALFHHASAYLRWQW